MISNTATAAALRRRTLLAGAACALLPVMAADAAGPPEVRLGVVQFGTVQWVADVTRRHGLDAAHGFRLSTMTLANTDAGRVAIMAQQTDIVVSDWPFVAVQRAAGTQLCFWPFSTLSGGIMTRADSPIRTLADLAGRRLGVAGGPADKSWLVVQAATRVQAQVDLAAKAQVVFGAPPLLGAKLEQGELDAVLTFWNFAARLEAAGFRQAVSVSECAAALGLPPGLSLVGYVFREDWARANIAAIDGFLAASAEAERLLASTQAEWPAVRPLMGEPDDALFSRLRERFSQGQAPGNADTLEHDAERLFAILLQTGGTKATGGLTALPPGIFWRARHGVG